VRATIATWPTTTRVSCAGGVANPTARPTPRPTADGPDPNGPTNNPQQPTSAPSDEPLPTSRPGAAATSGPQATSVAVAGETPLASLPAASLPVASQRVVTTEPPTVGSIATPAPGSSGTPGAVVQPAGLGLLPIGLIGLVAAGVGGAAFLYLRRR
jgi:hypothetical protein